MSIKKFFALFSILFILIIAVYNLNFNQSDSASPSYQMNISEFSSHGQVDRLRLIKINDVDLKKLTDSDQVQISAEIKLPFDSQNSFDYKWTLGQKVELVEGSINGSLKDLKKDEPQIIRIKVRGYSAIENRHIALEVWGQKNNQRIYSDALISSQKEQSFEYTVQQVERIRAHTSGIKK